MSFGIANFDALPHTVKLAFEDLEAYVNTFLLKEHNPDGTHAPTARSTFGGAAPAGAWAAKDVLSTAAGAGGATGGWGVGDTGATAATEAAGYAGGRRWTGGGQPWTLDDPTSAALEHVVGIRPPDPPAGTYHNYAPLGIDGAVMLELQPSGAMTLTGITVADRNQKRLMAIRNRDSTNTITMKHADTGSLAPNRFSLPNSLDLAIAPGQNHLLYYDPGRAAWTVFSSSKAQVVLTTDVTGVLPAANGGASVLTTTFALTEAQLEAMPTTPVTVIAAVAGKVIVPIWWAVKTTITVTAGTGYGTAPSLDLEFTGSTTNIANSITPGFSGGATRTVLSANLGMLLSENVATLDYRNRAVVVSLSTALTNPGDAAATVDGQIWYVLFAA